MKKTTICIIAAVAEDEGGKGKVIGINNRLPWHLPEDLRHFKRLTLGHPIVMGRKTFDSVGRPLPGRTNIVITRNNEWRHPECIRAESLSAAITIGEKNIAETAALSERKIFIIGGGQIYVEAMPLADRLYLTEVDLKVGGDVFFPRLEKSEWQQADKSPEQKDGRQNIPFRFAVYERKRG